MLPSTEKEYRNKIKQLQIEQEQVGTIILMEINRIVNKAEYLSEDQKSKLLKELWKGRVSKETEEM